MQTISKNKIKLQAQTSNKPLIIIDERERGAIRKCFNKFNCTVQIETIPVADYIISSKIGIERKRGDDLVASICDNRFFLQLDNLRNCFEKPLLILENPSKMFERRGVYEGSIYGAILYTIYKYGISIIPTTNEMETARIIYQMAKITQKEEVYHFITPKKPKESISRENQIFFLEGLLKIGKKKANILLDNFKTPYLVIKKIQGCEILYTKSRNPKGVSDPFGSLKGFGIKFISENKNLIDELFKK